MFEVKHDSEMERKIYFVYKIITCPIRANILDIYSKLEKCIMVLANLSIIYGKASWYLSKGHLEIR